MYNDTHVEFDEDQRQQLFHCPVPWHPPLFIHKVIHSQNSYLLFHVFIVYVLHVKPYKMITIQFGFWSGMGMVPLKNLILTLIINIKCSICDWLSTRLHTYNVHRWSYYVVTCVSYVFHFVYIMIIFFLTNFQVYSLL